jgi:hypothetical protein
LAQSISYYAPILYRHATKSGSRGITIYIKWPVDVRLCKNRSGGKILLQSLESFFTSQTLHKLDILLKKLGHRLSYLGEIRNEAPIITSKTKKLTNLMH